MEKLNRKSKERRSSLKILYCSPVSEWFAVHILMTTFPCRPPLNFFMAQERASGRCGRGFGRCGRGDSCQPLGTFGLEFSCVPKGSSWADQVLALLPIHCKEISIYAFPEKELRGLSPNLHIHVSLSDLYIPTIGSPIFLQQIVWEYVNRTQKHE
jgi:hypothetical protein